LANKVVSPLRPAEFQPADGAIDRNRILPASTANEKSFQFFLLRSFPFEFGPVFFLKLKRTARRRNENAEQYETEQHLFGVV